ncbi:DNA-directed RNA polymerase II subunit 4 [Klebsormidium nitens]|uniref:DNA-directed RNA polymerase II subunit 4 n=1 Tax=Klebsormidium nitens TaxID=105231 RepID=A0A0U9HIV6_KLENI|nr:DNA-directed RNA polymerase II subunit 4 [Klebsormidium nitens]|eukprot:GAQ80738.1 DNA-directed RNA polymerase II subunit 4 [Klebsormidium nitens]
MARDLSEEEEDAQQLKLGGGFQRAQCLLNAEVIGILEQRQHLEENNNQEFTPTPVFDKSLEYAKRFRKYNNLAAATEARKELMNRNLEQFEICVIGNLCPVSAAEAKAIQASLPDPYRKDKEGHPDPLSEDDIEKLLTDIAHIRRFNN